MTLYKRAFIGFPLLVAVWIAVYAFAIHEFRNVSKAQANGGTTNALISP